MVIEQNLETEIIRALEGYTGCTVVLTNQVTPVPAYPYISYTITTPAEYEGGTYCRQHDIYYLLYLQTWSVTMHSDDNDACQRLGLRMYDFFRRGGREILYRKNIAVASLTNLTTRDNLLTVQFEYRTGLDVTFRLMHRLDTNESFIADAPIRIQNTSNRIPKGGF